MANGECSLCQIRGKRWAEEMLVKLQVINDDIVWFSAEAEAAFEKTDVAKRERSENDDQQHRRGFLSGAVDYFEQVRRTSSLRFPIEP